MNISIYKTRKVFTYLVFLLLPLWVGAQSVEYHSVLKDDTLVLNYYNCSVTPLQIQVPPVYGTYLINGQPISPVWGNNLELSYIPNPGYAGLDTFTVISSNQSGGGGGPVTKILIIEVVDYVVEAFDDFAVTNVDVPVNIAPLSNDNGSGTLSIDAIPLSDYGTTVVLPDNTVDFTPAPGFIGAAQFHYTVCVGTAQCDAGFVTIFVEPVGDHHDSLFLSTRKNVAKDLYIQQSNGYSVLDAPVNGTLTSLNDGQIRYTPNQYFTGVETFRCAYNTNNVVSTRLFTIDILDAPAPNSFANDDYAYSSADGSVDIAVLENDEGFNLNLAAINSTPNHGTYTILDGVITYYPDLGYTGLDRITYTSCTPTYDCEQAEVFIFIGNMTPSPTSYDLSTPINTPFVINYGVPIENWDFILNNANSSNGGTLSYEAGFYNGTVNGQTISGYNLLIYTPATDFTGADAFSFQYCVDADCETVDIVMDVTTAPNANITDYCIDGCVWSGDANSDGLVNMLDLLPIGYCMGETGEARPDGEILWYGQYGSDWEGFMSQSGANVKHIDTDGDGTVTTNDTIALNAFYGQYHNLTPEPNSPASGIPLYFVTRTENPGPGDYVEVDIFLGIEANPALDISGLTFPLYYNTDNIEPGSFHVNFTNDNWLSYGSPMMSLTREGVPGHIDAGYTRTDGAVESGYGKIATADFIITDVVDGNRLRDSLQMKLGVGTPTAMGLGGMYSHLKTQDHWITIYAEKEDNKELSDSDLIAYPNPTQDVVNLHLNGNNAFRKVSLYSIVGQPIESFELDGKQTSLDVSNLINGMYILRVVTDNGFISKKIEVMKQD